MVKISITEASIQRSDTKSDLTEDYVDSIETLEEPIKKPPVPRPRTGKAKAYETTESIEMSVKSMDKISSISEQYDSSNVTMKSDPKSYKDNIRSRFQKIKSNSSKSLIKAKRKGVETNLEEGMSYKLIKQENEELESKLKNKERYDLDSDITKEDKYKFFCEEIQCESTNDIETKQEFNNFVSFFKPDDLSTLVADTQHETLHVLNGWTSVIQNTIDTSLKINQDGIYKPEPQCSRKFDLNLLEKRLVESEHKDWLSGDGHFNFLDNPRKTVQLKPVLCKKTFTETTYVLPILDLTIPEEVIIGRSTHIDITFKSVRFTHHPLFSIEHVLQEMLLNQYDSYRNYIVNNILERLSKKLDSLRAKVINHKGQGDNSTSTNNVNVFKTEIANLREKLFQEGKVYRDNMKAIFQTWKNIKKVRSKNGHVNTSIKLTIRKESANLQHDEVNWKNSIDTAAKEIQQENEQSNVIHLKEYKRELRKWKNEHPDEDIPADVIQPESKLVDFDSLRDLVVIRFKDCFRWPGEPVIHFNINYDVEITNNIESVKENQRRDGIKSTKTHLNIFFNDIQVCTTKPTVLNDNFTLIIDDSISLKPDILPKFLRFEICEQTENLPTKSIGSTQIDLSHFRNEGKVYEGHFSCDNIVHFKHDAVGCGNNIFEKLVKKYDLFTTGNSDVNFELAGVLNYTLNVECKQDNPDLSEEIVEDITEAQIVDPENPKNVIIHFADVVNAVAEVGEKNMTPANLKSIFLLTSQEELQNNLRFKLLQLRERNEPEFTGMIIPNRVKEIPPNVLESYNRRISQEQNEVEEDQEIDETQGNKIIARRSLGRKQLRQIYVKVFQQCKNRENCLLYEDVVDEKSVPQIQLLLKTVVINFFNWFKLQPKLSKPIPKIARSSSNKKTQLETSDLTNSTVPKIKIHLIEGMNFPNRKSDNTRENSDTTSSKADSNIGGTIRPFVEVSINNLTVESNVAEGGNPKWNDELVIPLESSSTDYLGPNSLSGSISMNIFDVIEEHHGTRKNYSKWLGCLQIPISAISSTAKMQGFFPVKQNVLFDYEFPNVGGNQRSPVVNLNAPQKWLCTMYIHLEISMEPHVPKLSPDLDNTPCNEPPFLKQHLLRWSSDYNNSHSDRKCNVFALDIAGRSTCITRYIRSLEPPQINREGFDVTASQCAKYIAMIPFTESNKFYENIWLNTEQLLKYQIGSITDHAIALTCYLLALNLEVWLLLGSSLPHGNTVGYALEREYIEGAEIPTHYVYDVATGLRYNVLDTMCPLQKVFCVVNEMNVWGNIQRESDIMLTRFDFSRRFDWLPLFNNQISAPTSSVQIRLVYTHTYDIVQLETMIENKLRKKITKSRKLVRTVWNRAACLAVKNILKRFEISHMHGRKQSAYSQNSEFKTICRNYGLKGFIVNIPFDRISSIADLVQTTRIFDDNTTNELVMAVSVQPYPNNILNLWLALGYSTQ